VGADQSDGGGNWNGPADSKSGDFAYVAIPEDRRIRPGCAKPYSLVTPALRRFDCSLPPQLKGKVMHFDPDFDHLTYGDQGQRAAQILSKVGAGDLLVFYAGLADVHPNPQLIYAIIGLYVIASITPAVSIPKSRWGENAHTRRVLSPGASDIVVRARPGVSGRLERCLPIGSYRQRAYRVWPSLLKAWGGLSVNDGYLQRSARLPEFCEASRFYAWFKSQKVRVVKRNN
jgi:hypothetical protein